MNISNICGFGLSFTMDGFRELYIGLCLLTWTACLIFAPRYLQHDKNKKRFYIFSIITLVATIGVFASADLFTLFTFFEIMSLASYVWVAQEENEKALKAADTYMAVAVIGGLVLLMGIMLLYTNIGTVEISKIKEAVESGGKYGSGRLYAAGFCMFFGFAAKAGAFPVHIWLPKAHPVAPAPASALLSGVLTKAGVFGIMIVSFNMFEGDALWGCFVMAIGIITMVLGALLALFSVDIKRTLACSSVSQIGFIVVGISAAVLLGEEGSLAKYGTLLHMVNHTLVKLCVFLVAGVIYQNTHSLNLNDIRGFGKHKPFLGLCFALGGLSLAGIPGFLGYLSKTAIHEALLETGVVLSGALLVKSVEIIFLFSGGCTLCYMTKLYMCVFVERNRDKTLMESYKVKEDYISIAQKAAIITPAVLVLALGILVAIKDDYTFFVLEIMKGSFVSISMGIALYFFMVRMLLMDHKGYSDLWPRWLDMEEHFYKPVIMVVLPTVLGFFMRIMDDMLDSLIKLLRRTVYRDAPIAEHRYEGTWFTHMVGHTADIVVAKRTGEEVKHDIEHRMELKHMENAENVSLAKRSLSFGLFMACVGMFVMLGFILVIVFF